MPMASIQKAAGRRGWPQGLSSLAKYLTDARIDREFTPGKLPPPGSRGLRACGGGIWLYSPEIVADSVLR